MSRMKRRWGLRAKMTASYLLVTAAAVLVMEIVVLAVVLPGLAAPPDEPSLTVQLAARDYATRVVDANARLGRLPTASEIQLGEPGLVLAPGETSVDKDGGVHIPYVTTAQDDAKPMSLVLLLDPDLRIVASSYPARYPVGGQLGGAGVGPLPVDVIDKFAAVGQSIGDRLLVPNGEVVWAVEPVPRFTKDSAQTVKDGALGSLGLVYVQVPATVEALAAAPEQADTYSYSLWEELFGRLGWGLLVLLAALPVGVVFGLLSTRPLIRRLRRLATSTVAVADGQYQHRVPVSGTDEVAQLESNFNRMAGRLSDAMAAERQLASAGERARIARELHDSISQDLFSLRLLAGGLRRALPADSPLYPQVETMERTATGTMHEMQALLLELRPVALQDAGLIPAIDELCHAYRDRLGVAVDADLEPVELDSAVEHAVLRIVQEALANAVKHARPNRIAVRIRREDPGVAVSITDDGGGFDPSRAGERHGMGLAQMRDRVAELAGTFEVDSTPGGGTTVRILLPRSSP